MNHHHTDLQQKGKFQRPGNRNKTSQKVDQHKIDEILGQDLPGTPPHVITSNDFENQQSSKPGQYGSYQGSSALPGANNRFNKNQKLPVLPPLGQSKKQDHTQKSSQQSHQNISNDANGHFLNKRRSSDSSNNGVKNNNVPRPTFELPKLLKKVDKFAISADLSDLENSESCSSAPEEFKKTLPKMISKSNSIDNFNMTSTTIIEDFFHTSDESEYELDENDANKLDGKNDENNFSDYSFDEIISDSDNEYDKSSKKIKTSHLLTPQELQLCKDVNSIHNEVKQRIDKLLKIARNHFPATKDNTAMLTRLVEQSRACHEFHFLEKRTKYYEGENRGLTIALTSLEDIISNPQSAAGNNVNINNKVKFGLQRLNALQMRQAKRMSKELAQAQRKIKKLRAEISKLHTEMRASIKARRGGDGSLLIAEMNNNNNNNGNNVANFGGGSGADDDELAALKVEHQFSIAKEKAAVGVMQKENDELERIISTYEKRILLMTQKESNYSRLFKKKPANSNEKSPQKTPANSNEKSPQKSVINSNEKPPQKVHASVKSSLKSKPNQKTETKKEISPNKKTIEKEKSGNDTKNQKSQKNDQRLKQQNQNEEQKPQQVKKESPGKKSTVSSSSNKPIKNKKKEEEEEVPIIEVLSI